MFNQVILLIIVSSIWFTSCATKPKFEKGNRNIFTTDIRSDGSKRFVLVTDYQKNKRKQGKGEGEGEGRKGKGRKGKGERGGKKGKGGKDRSNSPKPDNHQNQKYLSDEDKREIIVTLLDKKIAESNYCRAGYIELDFSNTAKQTEIIGECVESASDEDKRRWD